MLTQDEYKLYTDTAVSMSDPDWQKVVALALFRLENMLCLEALPDPLPEDLKLLLANFICLMLGGRGDKAPVTSKKVRNFTINYGSNAASVFAKLKKNYGDIIAKYSACEGGFAVEKSTRCCCGRF